MEEINRISGIVVDCAIKVHSELGPGLLESVYRACLVHELLERGLSVRTEVAGPIIYKGTKLEAGYRIDVLVNECVILELKACEGVFACPRSSGLDLFEAVWEAASAPP